MDNVVSVRLNEEQMQILAKLSEATGWTFSQVVRQLLESAIVRPAVVRTGPILEAAAPGAVAKNE